MVVLEFMRGPQASRKVELKQARITLGRDPESDVVLLDQRASWNHCVIEWTEKGYTIIDQGSSNGTYLGDDLRPVTVPERLNYGESIWFGDTEVVFRTNLEVQGHELSQSTAKAPVGATMTLNAREALAMMEQVHRLKQSKNRRPKATGGRQLNTNPAEIWEGVTDESVVVDSPLTEEDIDNFPESFRLRARLSFLDGPHTGREVFLGSQPTTFGRDSESVVVLEDDMCSRHHAELVRDDKGQYHLRDLGSRNGTALNGKDIRARQQLQHRALITMGQSIIEFYAERIDQRNENPLATVAMSLPLYAFQGKVLTQYEITLGLDPTSDLFLDDRSVDRNHATLSWRGDHFQIRDTSDRGTKVNGKRIIQHNLNDDDEISIGIFTLKVNIEGLRCNLEILKQAVEEEAAESFVAAAPEKSAYKTIFHMSVPAVLQPRVHVEKDEKLDEGIKPLRYKRKKLTWVAPLETRKNWRTAMLVAAGVCSILAFGAVFFATGGGLLMNDPLSTAHNSKKFSAVAAALDDTSASCNACHSPFQGVVESNCKDCHSDISHYARHVESAKSGEAPDPEVAAAAFDTACGNCHKEHQSLEELREAATAQCMSCHTNNPHKNGGPGRDTKAPEGIAKAQKKAQGIKIRALSTEKLHAAHSKIQRRCVGCHAKPDESGPEENPGASCGRCHSDVLSEDATAQECYSCHGGPHGKDLEAAGIAALVDIDEATIEAASEPFASAERFSLMSLAKGMGLTFLLFIPLGLVIGTHGAYRFVRRNKAEDFIPPPNPDNWYVLIDPELCVGIGACAYACPYNVIEMEPMASKPDNKQAVAKRIGACHGCKACERVCTPNAIIVVKAGEGLPSKDFPDLDPNYQVPDVPGLFIIGQTTEFKGLMKNAANLGYRVVQHLTRVDKLAPGHAQAKGYDCEVFIAGAGPGGISAAVSAKQAGLSYVICEKAAAVANTHRNMPKGKALQANPPLLDSISPLPMFDGPKEQVIEAFEKMIRDEGIQVQFKQEVKSIKKDGEGFVIQTTNGQYRALKVVLAIGNNGNPRKPRCPGEDLDKVKYRLVDPDEYNGKKIVVLGGGNSAVEAAFALARSNGGSNEVILSYRKGQEKMKISGTNKEELNKLAAEGKLKLMLGTSPVEIKEHSIILKDNKTNEQTELPNDTTFVFFGSLAPRKWLEKMGVKYVAKPANWNPGPTSDLTFLE